MQPLQQPVERDETVLRLKIRSKRAFISALRRLEGFCL